MDRTPTFIDYMSVDGWQNAVGEGAAQVSYDSWNANFVRNRHAPPKEASGTSFTMAVNARTEMFGMLRFVGRGD